MVDTNTKSITSTSSKLLSLFWVIARNIGLLIIISFILFLIIDRIPAEKSLDTWSDTNQGLIARYVSLLSMIIHLDLGTFEGIPMKLKIIHGLWISLLLIAGGIFFSLCFGFILGLLSHLKREMRFWTVLIASFDWISLIPIFILGYFFSLILFSFFKITTDMTFIIEELPRNKYLIFAIALPALILGIGDGTVSEIIRNAREELLKANEKKYMQAVQANGGNFLRHLIRSALLPILITLNLRLVHLLGGVIVVEKIFNLKGLGWLTIEGVRLGNRELLFSVSFILVVVVMAVNLLNELLIFALDPLIREKSVNVAEL